MIDSNSKPKSLSIFGFIFPLSYGVEPKISFFFSIFFLYDFAFLLFFLSYGLLKQLYILCVHTLELTVWLYSMAYIFSFLHLNLHFRGGN